jgi:hypothetical protein
MRYPKYPHIHMFFRYSHEGSCKKTVYCHENNGLRFCMEHEHTLNKNDILLHQLYLILKIDQHEPN